MNEHRIPAVDRAVQVLDCLARERRPLGVRELAAELDVPRSTVYRLINSLEAGSLVAKAAENTYVLGSGLRRLAQAVPQGFDLVALARPRLEALAVELQLNVKLSVVDDGMALVVFSAVAPTAYSVSTQVGRRFPLHAGAASKVLAAYLEPGALQALLPARLERHTEQTITTRALLSAELRAVRRAGYATDRGEFASGVEAFAAPVFGPDGACVASVSVPFFMDESPARRNAMLAGVRAAARAVSAALGAPNAPADDPG